MTDTTITGLGTPTAPGLTDLIGYDKADGTNSLPATFAQVNGILLHNSLAGLTTGDPHTQYALTSSLGALATKNTVATGDIDNDSVTFAKMQNIATDRLLGRDTASSGDVEELTVGGGIEFTGSGGIQRGAISGDVTIAAGGSVATIANGAVSYAKMQNVSAASRLLGRGDSGSGDPQEITLGSGLTMTGTTLSASGGSGAPTDAQYVTLAANGSLSAERVLTAGTNVTITDGTSIVTLAAGTTSLVLSGVISPSQLTADQNDYNPTGLADASIIRLDGDSSFRSITGLAGGASGRIINLLNIGSNSILLRDQDAGSTAGNRFALGGDHRPVLPGCGLQLIYDGTSSRWRPLDQGLQMPMPRQGLFVTWDGWTVGTLTTPADARFYHVVSGTGATFATAAAGSAIAGKPGFGTGSTGSTTTGRSWFGGVSVNQAILLGNSSLWLWEGNIRLTNLSDGTDTYSFRAGFCDTANGSGTDGVFLRYTHSVNSGNWELVARNNNVETVTNASSGPSANTWHTLRVWVYPDGTAEFFMDGASLGTVTSGLPTASGRDLSHGCGILKSAGTNSRTWDHDYQAVTAWFGTPR